MPSQLATAVVALINSTNEASLRQLLAVRLSPRVSDTERETILRLCVKLNQQGGYVRLRQEESAGRGAFLHLWADTINKGAVIYVEADPDTPAHIARVAWLVAIHPAAEITLGSAAPTDRASLVHALTAACARLADADALSGVVLVAHRDHLLSHTAFGLADRAARRPISLTTRFHQGSMGKMFTSVAIAQLIDAGQLALTDCLGDLLPAFGWREEAQRVTVSQLLSHTAGFGMLFDRPGFSHAKPYRTSSDLVRLFAGAPLLFPPGAHWSYSNEGFEVLGAIIEQLSALTYVQYIRDKLFRPAHMLATDAVPADDYALAYASAENDPFGIEPRVVNHRVGRCSACGGWYGTAADLLRFATALHQGALVSKQSLARLTAPRHRFPGPFDDWYGYGFIAFEEGGQRIFGHSGGGSGSGVCTSFTTFADGSYTVVTLTNYDPPVGERLSRAIIKLLVQSQTSAED